MIATLWVVPHGPWPGQDGSDTWGFRSAVDILTVIERRLASGEAGADDRTRYRIACGTVERGAREAGTAAAHVDAGDLLAWLDSAPVRTVYTPAQVGPFALRAAEALAGSGELARAVAYAVGRAGRERAGLVVTLEPFTSQQVVRAGTRPDRPVLARTIVPDPDLAARLATLPRTADAVFADDHHRLRSAETLREQIRAAVRNGEPLPIGSQARHEVLTEVLRELHHPDAPAGAIRVMYATEASEGAPFPFGPLPAAPAQAGEQVALGLMSIRHTELDADVSGYWFRNRLVSVPGRSQAESEAYCHRDSVARLHRLADDGITDLHLTHTGYEPAALGFYRAVAEVVPVRPLRVHPRYLIRGAVRNGTPWPETRES